MGRVCDELSGVGLRLWAAEWPTAARKLALLAPLALLEQIQ